MDILLILGIFCSVWGITALAKPTKKLPFSLKYAPVVLTAMGAFLIWSHLAATVPVISQSQVDILAVHQNQLTLDIHIRKDRQCKFVNMSAFVVTPDGLSKEAKLQFLEDPTPDSTRPTGMSDLGKTLVISYDPGVYSSFYFVTEHKCQFNNSVLSKFGETKMPEAFNTR